MYGMLMYGMLLYGMLLNGMPPYGMLLYGMLQYGVLQQLLLLLMSHRHQPLKLVRLHLLWRSGIPCRLVVFAMIISLAGVVMIAQPSFIFGGQGINKLGLALGIMQVSQQCMCCCMV